MTPASETQPLSCPEMLELLTEYLDDALGEQDRVSFDAHLGLCPGCVTYLDQFRETVAAAGTLAEGDVPAPVMHDLLRAFDDWRTRRVDAGDL